MSSATSVEVNAPPPPHLTDQLLGKVAVLKTSPDTVLDDIARLMQIGRAHV